MQGHHTVRFAYFIAAFAVCFVFFCVGKTLARALNPLTETLVIRRTVFPTPLFRSSQGTITLYDAAQEARLPMLEPLRVQVGPAVFSESAVSLVFSGDDLTFDPSRNALGALPSKMRVAFASGINDDAADKTQERTENEALFYSATNATRGVSENALRGGAEQARSKSPAAGSSAAPPSGGLFSQSGLQAN